MNRRKIRPHEVDLEPPSASTMTAVLGPTNTGKTHHAVERMLTHPTGMIGLPLRLLAREVYDRLAARLGDRAVALVTGEEKITPVSARYVVSTVEAMPLERRADFVAIDEIQLCADRERGRIFTSRLTHARGRAETMFLGSETMRHTLRALYPQINFQSKERFSTLAYSGARKVTRLARRSAIVGFSADTVYAIAELVRRQRGGAAVVLGALSPRTRNAQAALYQSGEVDYLVATDAIGMGLNMDIDHVAFSARRKFDGLGFRDLTPQELAQVAGRAGRHIRDGTFGVTADCPLLDEEVVEAIEAHRFDPVAALQWRTDTLDFSSLSALRLSLDRAPPHELFVRCRADEDEIALARLCLDEGVRARATGVAAIATLWDVCQIPDFRKTAFDQHVALLDEIFKQIIDDGRIGDAFLAPRIERLERADGDIDAISARIAHVRTWTYLSNRAHWVENASYWQERTRAIEDSLSDALHEKLTQRFVDRRTSALLKKLKDEAPLLAGVTDDGDVIVEGQFVGCLLGFEFIVDPRAKNADARRVRYAAERALGPVLAARAAALATAGEGELALLDDGVIAWRNSAIAELRKGPAPLRPELFIRGLDALSPNLRGRIQDRLKDFLAARIEGLLAELIGLKVAADSTDPAGLAPASRGIAFRLVENFGAMSRIHFGDELKTLPQDERAKLRKLGIRFGEYTLHVPSLLKPAAARLMTLLWALWTDKAPGDITPPKPGLVSLAMAADRPHAYYYALGYRPSGERAVRIDMLERLAQQIRSARDHSSREGFEATPQMMSLVGCSGEDFEGILRSLGYRKNTVKRSVLLARAAAAAAAAQNAQNIPAEAVEGASNEVAPDGDVQVETDAPAQAPPAMPAEISDALMAAEPVAIEVSVVEEAQAESLSASAEPVAVSETVDPDVALWRLAPRRPPQPRQNNRRPQRDMSDGAARSDRPRRDGGAPPQGERRDSGRRDGGRRDDRSDQRQDQRANGARTDRGRTDNRGEQRRDYRGDGRRDNQRDRRRDDGRERVFSSAPQRDRREPDPNSPFAILAALKTTSTEQDKT
jgi:ATP-dependent RNA helicase SUPV3L1/SUV3